MTKLLPRCIAFPYKNRCLTTALGRILIGEVIRPDPSNSGEFKRQTASEVAILIHPFLRNCSDSQSVSAWFYKETEIKI